MSKSPGGEKAVSYWESTTDQILLLQKINCVCENCSEIQISVLTLDDETETKTTKGQVGKHRLFLRQAYNVTFCVVAAKLESQGKLSRLNILFDLKGKQINVSIDAPAYKQDDL